MDFLKAVKKLRKRRQRKGFYEASDILTAKEKNSIIVVSASLLVPILVTLMMLIMN